MEFEYKEDDKEGMEILESMAAADKLNHWMYSTIAPYCEGEILEIGSGLGNISQYFFSKGQRIYFSDIRPSYRDSIKEKFKVGDDRVLDIDIVHPDFNNTYSNLIGKFDSIFCLNVVEHIKEDRLAVENMMKMLKPGGRLTVLVPAHQFLYNGIDKALYHFKRYNRKMMLELAADKKDFIKVFYFNSVGIPAWFIGGLINGNTIPKGEMKLYNYIVPVCKLIDAITFKRIGLSVIGVMQKK